MNIGRGCFFLSYRGVRANYKRADLGIFPLSLDQTSKAETLLTLEGKGKGKEIPLCRLSFHWPTMRTIDPICACVFEIAVSCLRFKLSSRWQPRTIWMFWFWSRHEHSPNFIPHQIFNPNSVSRFTKLSPNGSPSSDFPGTSPFLHRDTNFYTLEDLDPSSQYDIDLYIIPAPGAAVEMVSERSVLLRTRDPVRGEKCNCASCGWSLLYLQLLKNLSRISDLCFKDCFLKFAPTLQIISKGANMFVLIEGIHSRHW